MDPALQEVRANAGCRDHPRGPGARRRCRGCLRGRPGRRSAALRQDACRGAAGVLHDRGHRADLAARGRCRRGARGAGVLGRSTEPSRAGVDREGEPAHRDGADLGAALARLHDPGAPSFGREDRRTTGSRGLPNEPCATWAEFYATNRLLPLARLAARARALVPEAIAALERLAGDLERFDRVESHRRACTVTCGPATGSSTRRVELVDRPGRARRTPGVRPRDDATLRWIRAGLLHRVRGGASTGCRVGGARPAPSDRPARRARDQVRRSLRRGRDGRGRPLRLSGAPRRGDRDRRAPNGSASARQPPTTPVPPRSGIAGSRSSPPPR